MAGVITSYISTDYEILPLEFRYGGLHGKHVVATWNCREPSQHLLEDPGKPRKTRVEMAGHRTFRVPSQRSYIVLGKTSVSFSCSSLYFHTKLINFKYLEGYFNCRSLKTKGWPPTPQHAHIWQFTFVSALLDSSFFSSALWLTVQDLLCSEASKLLASLPDELGSQSVQGSRSCQVCACAQ